MLKLLSTGEVAKFADLSREQVRRLSNAGRIVPVAVCGRERLFTAVEVQRYLQARGLR